MRIIDRTWWAAVARPLIRTALAGVVPFVPALVADPAGAWQVAVLTVALAVVGAVGLALVSLPDAGVTSWWERALRRAVRQFGQMLVASTASAVLLTDVDWGAVGRTALASALVTVILAALGQDEQPETMDPAYLPPAAEWHPGALTDLERQADLDAATHDPTPGTYDGERVVYMALTEAETDAALEARGWLSQAHPGHPLLAVIDKML